MQNTESEFSDVNDLVRIMKEAQKIVRHDTPSFFYRHTLPLKNVCNIKEGYYNGNRRRKTYNTVCQGNATDTAGNILPATAGYECGKRHGHIRTDSDRLWRWLFQALYRCPTCAPA